VNDQNDNLPEPQPLPFPQASPPDFFLQKPCEHGQWWKRVLVRADRDLRRRDTCTLTSGKDYFEAFVEDGLDRKSWPTGFLNILAN